MKSTTVRWTTAMAAAAMLTMPVAGLAQTPSEPQSQTPPQTPTQPQPQTQPPATPEQPAAAQPDANKDAAKAHLTAARNTLSQLTQLPAASQLQGNARAQVSQLINNFNELITTQANWSASFAKVEANLQMLLGSEPPAPAADPAAANPAGAVGTSGAIELDPAVRTKLVEFRDHLAKFEQAATGATAEPNEAADAAPTPTTPAPTEPAAQTPQQQTPPATPPTSQNPPVSQTPPNQPIPNQPVQTAQADPDAQQPDAQQPADPEEVLRHIDAIEAIVGAQAAAQAATQTPPTAVGTTGTPTSADRPTGAEVTLTSQQVQQLRRHLAELRKLVLR